MQTLWQDLRYSLRTLRRNPGFTTVAILTLALAIGANSAIFSVINGVILQPLPYEDPGRLVMLWTTVARQELYHERSAFANFEDWRKQSRSFEYLAAFDPYSATLTGADVPDQIGVARVTPSLFSVLGAAPMAGRTFSREQAERRERVLVLSHAAWRNRFGASKDVIGKTIQLDGRALEIVGVMPEGFAFPDRRVEGWEPHTLSPDWEDMQTVRGTESWFVVGRLKHNSSLQEAQSEMDLLAARLEKAFPAENAGLGIRLVPLHEEVAGRDLRLALWMLLGAVLVVLLIACTNVATLQLVRAAKREREFALRTALGARRSRLLRQLLTETAVLLLAAGALGLLLAESGVGAFIALSPGDIPRLDQVSVDANVLLFTLAVSALAVLIVTLAPVARISSAGLGQILKEGGRSISSSLGARRRRAALVSLQFTLAVVLLAGAGLLIRSFQRIQRVDPGFRPDSILLMQMSALQSRTPGQTRAFYREVLDRLKAIPGVESAGAVNDFFIGIPGVVLTIEGREALPADRRTHLGVDSVTPGFFETMGAPLISGRFFSEQDGPNAAPVAIVNETMARRFWPQENAVGKRFKLGDQPEIKPWITIVGVAGDMRRQGLDIRPMAQAFRPYAQNPVTFMNVVVRTVSDPLRLADVVRSEVHAIDKNVPVYRVSTLASRIEGTVSRRRFQTWLLGAFSALALVLTTIGIYGLMHHAVAERRHEIGIRMALGARAGDVHAMVVRQGLKLVLIGLAVGLALALALARTISDLLYEVTPGDPLTFAAVTLLLIAVAAAACYVPARRAAKVDPMLALRDE